MIRVQSATTTRSMQRTRNSNLRQARWCCWRRARRQESGSQR